MSDEQNTSGLVQPGTPLHEETEAERKDRLATETQDVADAVSDKAEDDKA